jgi:hypothetical protein
MKITSLIYKIYVQIDRKIIIKVMMIPAMLHFVKI